MTLMKTDNTVLAETIEQVLVTGDLARLTPEQRNIYYKSVCDSLGLNPLTRPFEYITLNGKLTLYARKDATDQLRKLHRVSVAIVDRSIMDDLMVVTATATDATGRTDSSIGAVSIASLRGEAKANALMKAETKARRRVTLALCGLGMLDESELDGIPNPRLGEPTPRATDRLAAPAPVQAVTINAAPAAAPIVDPAEGSFETIDVDSIEEHPTKSGAPCWKITAKDGTVYAVVDPIVCEDISRFRADGRLIRAEVERKGKSRLIVAADGVSE